MCTCACLYIHVCIAICMCLHKCMCKAVCMSMDLCVEARRAFRSHPLSTLSHSLETGSLSDLDNLPVFVVVVVVCLYVSVCLLNWIVSELHQFPEILLPLLTPLLGLEVPCAILACIWVLNSSLHGTQPALLSLSSFPNHPSSESDSLPWQFTD